MKKLFVLAAPLGVAFSICAQEVSVFGSDATEPRIQPQIQDEPQSSQMQESIDGLRSLLEGLNKRNRQLNNKITDLENKAAASDYNISQEIASLRALIEQNKIEQDEKINKLASAIKGGKALIDKKPATTLNSAKNSDPKTPAAIFEAAEKSFKNKDYAAAKSAYTALIAKKYKSAHCNYMLGEIAYFTKNYKDAIPYYHASVSLNAKAPYMPRLLYHTGVSLDKIGKPAEANKFYRALKQGYPDSNEAKDAPNRK